jgi:hypothetical protein
MAARDREAEQLKSWRAEQLAKAEQHCGAGGGDGGGSDGGAGGGGGGEEVSVQAEERERREAVKEEAYQLR